MELDLEVWKHPEKKIHIGILLDLRIKIFWQIYQPLLKLTITKEYELKHDISNCSGKNTAGSVYLVIHGDQGKTGKIELNNGSFENSAKDDYVFNAPDVGKIAKIELFYTPTLKDNCK